jgi:hypothetical protein
MAGEHIGSAADDLIANEIPPQSITSGAAINGAGVDMQGWEDVLFVIQLGAFTGAGTLAARLESDDNASFTSTANITGAALVNVTNTQPNNVAVLGVARPTERFVRCVITQATNTVVAGVTSIRKRRTGLMPPTAAAVQTVVVKSN